VETQFTTTNEDIISGNTSLPNKVIPKLQFLNNFLKKIHFYRVLARKSSGLLKEPNRFPNESNEVVSTSQANTVSIDELPKPYFAEDNEKKFQYLERLDAKQLDLYDWCETKVSTLATIDTILFGVATLFLDKIMFVNEVNNARLTILNTVMVLLLLTPLFISLIIALWHIRPKMGKGKATSTRSNHRSVSGIHHFKSKDAYKTHFEKLTIKELCEDLISKIYGMNNNIWKNQKSIKIAVLFDLIGLTNFFGIIIYITLFK